MTASHLKYTQTRNKYSMKEFVCREDEGVPSPYFDNFDYAKLFKKKTEVDELHEDTSTRYISINDREDTSALPVQFMIDLQAQKLGNVFKSAALFKEPFDENITRTLIYDLKPQTIFEFGTCSGASANYMAMLLNEFKLNETKILTFDKYEEYRDKKK
eukprot:851279_1